ELMAYESWRKKDKIIEILSSDFKPFIEMIIEKFPKRTVLRSSDINEDSLKNRLPGFYTTKFVGNVDEAKYLFYLLNAVADICADYLDSDKVAFRSRKQMKDGLGLLAQDVVGRVQGDEFVNQLLGLEKFYPDLSGYLNAAFPDKVIVGFCKGLGSIAVDGKPHYIFEYSRRSGEVKATSAFQQEVTYFENGRIVTKPIDRQVVLSEEFIKHFVENALKFEQKLQFPEGFGLNFEFAIPSLDKLVVYSIQNAPLPVKKGTVAIEVAESPLIKPGGYIGVGSKTFTNFVFMPPPKKDHKNGALACPYEYNFTKYNESHHDYLLFILPKHILIGNTKSPNGTYKFTNTYNAGGIVEVHESEGTHSPSAGATHFANFIRCIDQLFLSGEPTEHYLKLKENFVDKSASALIAGKGEIYMAVDENAKKGVLDLRKVDEIKLYEG
ncbi:hypothetical protein HYU07_04875, partial [Candidatus Woesearchaeota archaeon]|nr:hypothetical protein [Candidatus Woesearchaeota archaeon]